QVLTSPKHMCRSTAPCVCGRHIVRTVTACPPARDAIAGWLNLPTTIPETENPPAPSPLPSGPLGARLALGTQTSLDGAQRQTGWSIVVPSSLGAPEEVYVKLPPSGPSGGMVTLVYTARPGIRTTGLTGVAVIVTEARGRINEQYFM